MLIYKEFLSDKFVFLVFTPNKPLFTFLHSANFNSARTAALQDVTVMDNDFAMDCFKEDC